MERDSTGIASITLNNPEHERPAEEPRSGRTGVAI
jgi:hypothetical protein